MLDQRKTLRVHTIKNNGSEAHLQKVSFAARVRMQQQDKPLPPQENLFGSTLNCALLSPHACLDGHVSIQRIELEALT